MLSGKKIFITGGAGFIGSNLAARLAGFNRIVLFDTLSNDSLSLMKSAADSDISYVRGDVLDMAAVAGAMKGADIVVHAAAIAGPHSVVQRPVRTMLINMVGTSNVLEAARVNGVKERIIVFSTSEVFGSMAIRKSEESETITGCAGEPRWTYAASKLAAEHLAMAYHTEFSLPVVCVRPFNIYGPGQVDAGAVHVFISQALQNEPLQIFGDGGQIRGWCYIDDFLDCLLCCMEDEAATGEIFNIGNSGAVTTTYALAQTVCRVLGSNSEIVFEPPLPAEIALRIPNVDKAARLFGFTAKVDLEEGIRRTAAWMREREQQGASTIYSV